jgi:hypothetical protein
LHVQSPANQLEQHACGAWTWHSRTESRRASDGETWCITKCHNQVATC